MFPAIVKCYDTILPLGEHIINIPLYFRAVRQSIDSIPFMSGGYTIYGQSQVKYILNVTKLGEHVRLLIADPVTYTLTLFITVIKG